MSKKMHFENSDALATVAQVINEANAAISDVARTIQTSSIPEILGGVAGATGGAAVSFAALYLGGSVVGLSAAGITSGLAAAGALVGGGMAAGIGVLAAPVAVLAVAGYGLFSYIKTQKLIQAKEECLKEAIKSRDAILVALKNENQDNKQRIEYLNSLNILLTAAIRDLNEDLAPN